MSVIQVQNIEKSYFGHTLFSQLSFQLDPGDRLAILGENGSGKSTLLRLLLGLEEVDHGKLTLASGLRIGYLPQLLASDQENLAAWKSPAWEAARLDMEAQSQALADSTLDHEQALHNYQEALQRFEALGGYDYEYTLRAKLSGLGLSSEALDRSREGFSGGEKMKISLAHLLLDRPDVLLLDEPTNHLDLAAIDWLIDDLISYTGTLCVVSHDRYFLNRLARRCLLLENGQARLLTGNYEEAMAVKAREDALARKKLDQLEKEIERQQEVVQTLRSHRNISAFHSRQRLVEKLEEEWQQQREKLRLQHKRLHFRLEAGELPVHPEERRLLELKDIHLHFGERVLFDGLDIEVMGRDKIALLGPNGSGKTTLLNLIAGRSRDVFSGECTLAAHLQMAYMTQHIHFPVEGLSALETLLSFCELDEKEGRNLLAQYGFRENDVYKSTAVLSGGERSRLYLCCILQNQPQLLFLDEPTNHLDMRSREILEEAIQRYQGALLLVSHDRYFIEEIADRYLALENGKLQAYPSIQIALQQQRKAEANKGKILALPAQETPCKSVPVQTRPNLNPSQRRKQMAALQQELRQAEKKMEELEQKIAEIHASLGPQTPPSTYENLQQLQEELHSVEDDYLEKATELERFQQ